MKHSKRRQHLAGSHSEVDSEGSWAISYGDLVTLLLTFFIIFFTADKYEQQKTVKIEPIVQQSQTSADISSLLKAGLYPDESIKDAVQAKVFREGNKVIVAFSGVSFFPSGKVDLTPGARVALEKFYSMYQPYVGLYNLSIRAYTDNKRVLRKKGRSFKDNLDLSALRSVSVMRFFQHRGIPLRSMRLGGYGEYPMLENDTPAEPVGPQASGHPPTGPMPASTSKEKSSVVKPLALARTAVLVIEPQEAK